MHRGVTPLRWHGKGGGSLGGGGARALGALVCGRAGVLAARLAAVDGVQADRGAGYEEAVVLLRELVGCVYHDVAPACQRQ